MTISATIKNSFQQNEISVETSGSEKKISVPSKPDGFGSSVNGGELLLLSIATCFCNDIYREWARRNLNIDSVEVNVKGEFAREAEPGSNLSYEVKVSSPQNSQLEIEELIRHVDKIAEIHNTIRKGTEVALKM